MFEFFFLPQSSLHALKLLFLLLPNISNHLCQSPSLFFCFVFVLWTRFCCALCYFQHLPGCPPVIIDTDAMFVCWCSSDSWHDSTNGKCSGNVQSQPHYESWTHAHSITTHTRPGLERNCCTFFQRFLKCRFYCCGSRSLVTSQNRLGPLWKEACELGFLALDVLGQLGERPGCCPCWHKQLWMLRQSGPWGNLPLCESWVGASNMCARCKSLTCHGIYTPDASLLTQSDEGRHNSLGLHQSFLTVPW